MKRLYKFFFLLTALAANATAVLAQEWPSKSIRVVVPFGVGVGDAVFRTFAPTIESRIGQRFVLDNRPGAGGNIGTAEVVRAAPDGHTLLLATTGNFAVNQHLYKNLGFDPLTALDPITLLADAPFVVSVNLGVPAKTLKELADSVRENPGKLNFGSPGTGTTVHLVGATFSQMIGSSIVHVPFNGPAPVLQALLANDIQLSFSTLTPVLGPVKAGRLKVLAVLATQRIPELPDVPTSAEAGFPALLAGNWWVFAAPRGTDAHIINRLAAEVRAALADPATRKRIGELGQTPIGLPPAETAAFLRTESIRYKAIVERTGVKVE